MSEERARRQTAGPLTCDRPPDDRDGASVTAGGRFRACRTDTRQQPRVRGLLAVDLTDLEPWAHWHDEISEARSRLHTLAISAPAGAAVVIRPGSFRPWLDMFAGASIAHIGTITVESEDAEQIHRWTSALREKLG